MTKLYRTLKDITGTSEETIESIREHAANIANNENEPIQGRRASLLHLLHAYFDETQIRARKILNHINLYALGVCGPSVYADTKRKSDHPYNLTKSDSVNKLRLVLNRIQNLTPLEINQEIIVDIINELHSIKITLNKSINTQNEKAIPVDNIEKFYDLLGKSRSHTGGKIGAVINGKHYKMLMQTLAGLFIFARVKEQTGKKPNYNFDEKHNRIPKKHQPEQSQVFAAIAHNEHQKTKKIETSGKNLFALIQEQKRIANTGVDTVTFQSELKFESMIASKKQLKK